MRRFHPWLVALVLFSLSCAATPDRGAPPEPAAKPAPVEPVAPPPPPPDPRDFTAAVHFDVDSADLSAAGMRELTAFAAKLEPFPERRVHVVGYSEATGPEQADRWLSEQRAKSVASFLVSQGIPIDHVSLQGLGAEAPIAGAAQPDRRLAEVSVR
jgi:outer membrane protein OmpA-like peptidoglycan-associated protein